MVYEFSSDWAQEVADVSGSSEFQTCVVRIVDPKLISTDYDYDTGAEVVTGDGLLYEGQARVIGVRWGVNNQGASQANSTTISAIRVQIPFGARADRVNKGCQVFVTKAPRNPALLTRVFTVSSDMQGSSAASRTFECALDMDSVVG